MNTKIIELLEALLKEMKAQSKNPEDDDGNTQEERAEQFQHYNYEIIDMLSSIQNHAEDFYGKAPEEIDWADIGDITRTHEQIKDVHDRLNKVGEYHEV